MFCKQPLDYGYKSKHFYFRCADRLKKTSWWLGLPDNLHTAGENNLQLAGLVDQLKVTKIMV